MNEIRNDDDISISSMNDQCLFSKERTTIGHELVRINQKEPLSGIQPTTGAKICPLDAPVFGASD